MKTMGYKKAHLLVPVKIKGRHFQTLDVSELKSLNIEAKLFLTDWGLTIETDSVHEGKPENKVYFIPYNHISQIEN